MVKCFGNIGVNYVQLWVVSESLIGVCCKLEEFGYDISIWNEADRVEVVNNLVNNFWSLWTTLNLLTNLLTTSSYYVEVVNYLVNIFIAKFVD